ncbi:hypothetical protein I3843_02G049600 [Carya illinoinensis]|uniref:Pentatricopeptide repeat-containing protein n=1 Tax=Carya illinoinensis TaxID=32201 RepID=A0A922FSY4_CARIL|nr:hypothetical protein I3842_02G061700 [Carya illinoinensis]KAG6726063.1 hypothetical protein I3842_02G061700 [Carya illinoinensis]KAG7990938.1 hypothetical protein I3843_02G049600 [Carya illinoinensis]
MAFTWRPNSVSTSGCSYNNLLLFPKTITKVASSKFKFSASKSFISSAQPSTAQSSANASHGNTAPPLNTVSDRERLRDLLAKLRQKNSCPLQTLRDDGDWTEDHFWAVIRFLKHASRSHEILQVFDMWKDIEASRINEFYYEKIIGLLGEEGLIEEAVSTFQEMKSRGLIPSLETYNSIIHGFAGKGSFEDALFYLNKMKEANVTPETYTYDVLIQAYGKYNMYDEMGACLKKMELDGCSPDHITYNLLIQEFSQAGLLKRMERIYQTMLSKKMDLQSSTLVAMLEAYARFGIVDKMEKVFRRVLNSKTHLKDDVIRKVAGVYIGNYMFSRLDDLGVDVSTRFGASDLVWCLRLLSHACLLSRRGMDSIVREMEEAKVPWNVTVANIIMLAYLKIEDFTHLKSLLYQLPFLCVKPDIVTVGILFDAMMIGFEGAREVETWRSTGDLYRVVEMNTDPLVLTAFGKGRFLRNCEEVYCSLEPQAREQQTWTYDSLIDLVLRKP